MSGSCGLGHVGGDLVEVDRLQPGCGRVVDPGEIDHVAHEPRHPLALEPRPAHGVVEGVLVAESARLVELGVAADGRDRRSELVGHVGDEVAQSEVRGITLGERHLDVAHHRVERFAQLSGLGGRVGLGDPLGELSLGDGLCRLGHLTERTQAVAPDPPQRRERHDARGHGDDGRQPRQPPDGPLVAAQRRREDLRRGPTGRGGRHDSVLELRVRRPHGDRRVPEVC